MATTKTRINISVNKRTRDALKALAKRGQEPVATTTARLVEDALELEEDAFLSTVANRRLTQKKIRWLKDSDILWK